MNKIVFILGIAVGYVLGARRGRQGYENLKNRANGFWKSPNVQKAVDDVQSLVAEKAPAATPAVDALVDKIDDVSDVVSDAASTTEASSENG